MANTRFARVFVAGAVSALAVTSAGADEFRKATSGGRPVLLRTYASWDRTCAAEEAPSVRVTGPPANGSIATRHGSTRIQRTRFGAGEQCMGRTVGGVAVYYTPRPGFHGVDTAAFDAMFASGRSVSDRATIDVR